MKFTKRVWMHICLLRIFFDHVTVSALNTSQYASDSTDWTLTVTCALIGGHFMGNLVKSVFAIAFGQNSAIMSSFTFIDCNVTEGVTNWEDLWSPDSLRPCLQNYTAILMFRETTDDLCMKSCKSSGFPPQQLNKYLTSVMFLFTKITLFGPTLDSPISLWSILFNRLSNWTSP